MLFLLSLIIFSGYAKLFKDFCFYYLLRLNARGNIVKLKVELLANSKLTYKMQCVARGVGAPGPTVE